MYEQMFNIAAQFSAKLTLSLSFLTARLCLMTLLFPFSGIRFIAFLCAFVSLRLYVPGGELANRKGGCVTFFSYLPYRGSSLPHSRRAMPIVPQQRHAPSFSPRVRHYGGCSRVCRRLVWRKSRKSVARLVLAAVHFGDNFANFANLILRQKLAI
jgi:hypothetical protein